MLCGYTLILLVDKVAFDTHATFGNHEHGEEHGHNHSSDATPVRRASLALKTNISQGVDPLQIEESQRVLEEAMRRESMSKKTDRFARRVSVSMDPEGTEKRNSIKANPLTAGMPGAYNTI